MSSNGPRRRGAGTIGVCSGPYARYTAFTASIIRTLTMAPPGTAVRIAENTDVVGNMNELVRQMTGDWLWILGDDHTWEPTLLPQLVAHDADVVVPVCLTRTAPFAPVVYRAENEDGHYVPALDLPEDELVEIHAAGSAGMLVRRHVLDAIGDPWFGTDGRGLNEDLFFCRQVREHGFRIWCDTSAFMGHIGTMTVWPICVDGEWHIDLDLGNGARVPPLRYLTETEESYA